MELAIPKLREGSYFPDWLLTHRRRAEQALVSVVATAYLLGVSTRRVERLADQLGVKSLSRSQVSQMATHLDAQVAAFRERPLDAGPYTFVWVDALAIKVREAGRVVNVHALIATGVNADGHREILGLDVASAEDGAGWLAFLRGLVARGLSGVQLVISDAHPGLLAAIASALPGAAWQRCRTHYLRNLLTRVPKSAQPHVATQVRTIFDQADDQAVHTQYDRVVDALAPRYREAAEHLDAARAELLAFSAYPREIWRQIWSNNPQVILSSGKDHCCGLLFRGVDNVVDADVQQGPMIEEICLLGVSGSLPRIWAARRSPRACARASRSRLLSTSSWRMRVVATCSRWSREASEARCRSGTSCCGAGGGRWRRRSISARRSGWL